MIWPSNPDQDNQMTKFRIACLMFSATAAFAAAPLKDFKDYKDPALFTRLPNYYLSCAGCFEEKQFDFFEFVVGKAGKKERVEGHKTFHRYGFEPTAGSPASPLQIIRNYQKAATAIGGKVLFEDRERTTLCIAKNGKESWVEVTSMFGGRGYSLTIVEREAMKQDITANADAFRDGLAQTGHVEVPGIFFDFGKADVKPESEASLKEIVKLLQGNAALKLWVVGHTDSVGAADGNVKLSQARAAAVVQVLTQKMGVSAARLAPFGAGPYAPVASNAADEGRARNRRVELVAQ
jgi:outer membrane protein OmpA-like peptidoglycan-associated protein